MAVFLGVAALLAAAPGGAEAAPGCTLSRGGEIYCGGAQPVRVPVSGKVVQLAASGDSTCALTEPGEVYCWPAGETEAEPAGGGGGIALSPLLLISIGLALVGGGCALIKWAGGQGARSKATSRHRPAPSLSRSA
jgi:hypothetical protein